MFFSIITGTQNNEATIDRAIRSVTQQTGVDWELLVVNDGSTDATAAHVERWAREDARVRLINQAAAGVSAARNRALAEAQGDYVLFLDADDWFAPNSFTQLAEALTAHQPDILIYNFYDAKSETVRKHSDAFSEEQDWTTPEAVARISRYCATQYGEAWDVWYGNLHNVWGRCYRRALLQRNQVRFDEQLAIAEDWKFNLTVFPLAKTVSIRDVYLYNYFDNSDSVMHVHQWQGHAQFMQGYHNLAALLQQSTTGKAMLPYVAVDQLRDEFRLIVQSGLKLVAGSREIRTISDSPECQWALAAVDPMRLSAHDRLVYRLLQQHHTSAIWGIYYYQERVKPMIKQVIHLIVPRRWLPQRFV